MNRDSARKLSDSDFWQICHEMHPSTNYTFPVAPMLGVEHTDNLISTLETLDQRLGFDQHETSEDVSSDDSLQNLYMKKTRAHRKLLSAHSNCVNTQKILDTIDLFSDNDDDKASIDGENGKSEKTNDTNHKQNEFKLNQYESNGIDTMHNADDLLLKIADSVQQLKTSVNQMEFNEKCQTSSDAFVDGDLIDFSDDWTNGESDNNSNGCDIPIKKVTHSCVQGSPNDGVGNERLPYVKFQYRKNVLNNNTGRATVESNETKYDANMEVNNHRSGIQVNYCNEWHTENGNDYPSPTTSESSGNSCSYTDSLSNSSRSTTSDNLNETETETSNGHTCTNGNSHTLNTEHNRPYTEFEQCAYQIQANSQTTDIHDCHDKSLTVGWQTSAAAAAAAAATNSRAKINIETNNEKDISNGACAVNTFVTFTHTIRDNNEVNSSIEPKSHGFGVEKAPQDVLSTVTVSAPHSHSHTSCSNETKKIHINGTCVVTQPEPFAISSSFIKPLPLDTSTSVDTFSLQKQAEWDADKNNNPLHYKDKRTKALPFHTIQIENYPNSHTIQSNFNHFDSVNSVQFSASEKYVPILHEKHEPHSIKSKRSLSLASAASTPLFSSDADNKDENEHVAYVNGKICLKKNPSKTTKCKLKYRNKVYGCLCVHKFRITVRKSANKLPQKCRKRRGGGEFKCLEKSTNCTKRQTTSIDRRKKRIGKQVHWCNYKWKCCRCHLCEYDLCETLLVTAKCVPTKSTANSVVKAFTKHDHRKKANGVRNNCENFARNSNKNSQKTGDRFDDATLNQSQHNRHSGSNANTCDSTANVTQPHSSSSTWCDAVETFSTTSVTCDTDQSLKAINKALCIDSGNKEHKRLITSPIHKVCANDDDDDDDDVLADADEDADELKKTLELSPPIEKIKQVLNAVKCSNTDRSGVNCDSNRCVENATHPTKYDDNSDCPPLTANSLKNSLKFSESCDSIFTLKRSAIASSTSSLLSLNATEPFEASNRLRRLEERFKDFAITSLVAKKGRCVSNNLSPSSTSSARQHHIQRTLDGKGHLDADTEWQHHHHHHHHHHHQTLDTPLSIEPTTKSVTNKELTEPNSSHLNDGSITSGNECNLKYSDNNNNHIKLQTHSNETSAIKKTHICCSHTIQKRKQSEQLNSVDCESSGEFGRRKSPIGVEHLIENDSNSPNRQLLTSDKPNESIDVRQQRVNHPSINQFGDSNTVHPFGSTESQACSLKKDFTQLQQKHHQEIRTANEQIEDDKPNPNTKSSTKSLNDDHFEKINTHDSWSIYTANINSINIDDNKNNLEQTLNDRNTPKGINQNRNENEAKEVDADDGGVNSKENTSNANETKGSSTNDDVQQLESIANRLINCTPVSISTESEEICNLFPEPQRPAHESPFIYRDEELKTNCIFDVRQLGDFHLPPSFDQIYECYDELEDDVDDCEIPIYGLNVNQSKDILNNNDNDAELTSCDSEQLDFPSNYCQCTIESIVPLYPNAYHTTNTNKTETIMRDMTSSGTLRGLLKKPNRPQPSQKNRVIFDETRNEFFDADYIILVRDDCPYDEEDEEPCTCGEHELVRLCCDEGCQCTAYADDGRTPQSPKYAPPIEFVDQAALSPPEGYKDGGLQQALGGVLGSHIFGAQHIQQLQVIQRLQAKRAAMLAAQQRTNNNSTNQSGSSKNQSVPPPPAMPAQTICTECAECSECAAKQEHDEALPHMALLSIQATSPERRFTQKEIIAGEERPKYLLIKQHPDAVSPGSNVTSAATVAPTTDKTDDGQKTTIAAGNETRSTYLNSDISLKPTSISAQITGILKGGKLWKNETSDETTSSATSDDETSKRSVRFIDGANTKNTENPIELEQDVCDGESGIGSEQNGSSVSANDTDTETDTMKKHSTLFHNSLRPNSAVRQLFPSAVLNTNAQPTQALTHEALRAFDESKRSQLKPSIVHSDSETDTIRRTIERNALRRSLIKYEPKKKPPKPDTSLEERIRMLTCDVDEPPNDDAIMSGDRKLERRSSPTGEENPPPQPQITKYVPDKSFSPISTASSSSSSSISAYKKITDIFHKDKRQERIPEADENPIVIIPQQLQQDCRCPSAPDLGMGTHLSNTNNQLQAVRPSDARRQFLSTLAPLTACVAGQRDDMSFYSLAAGDRNSTGSSRGSEYSIGDIDAILQNDDAKKVAPDVIAGTPGQEQNDELAAFAQQEATRTERIKKRYNNTETIAATSVPTSNAGSDDDDEQNDYGFNHRPSVRGIKPRSNEEMLEEMQTQLSSSSVTKPPPLLPRKSGQSNTLPKANTQTLQSKLMAPVQMQQPTQSQQQIASIVHQQNISTWNAYYQEQAQRNSLPANTPASYFQHLPIAARHSFHQEEATIYQNCQGVAMEQHYHTIAARSPTRRPESPPPLRNYHQTMVLIPYNTEYAQITADQIAAQHFQHQNILEYQQVTQQTIRVPIGYPLPGMQLHVVTGNGNQQAAYAQYATAQRQQAQMNANTRPTYGYIQENQVPAAVKYQATERGAPEGAASILQPQSDCNALMQSASNNVQGNVPVTSTENNTQTSNTSTTAQQGAVFYAMNV